MINVDSIVLFVVISGIVYGCVKLVDLWWLFFLMGVGI